MSLARRILRVTLSMPGGDVVLDEKLALRISIQKAALAIQNRASVEIMGMTTSLRLKLLSQFTALQKRQVSQGQASQDWIPIKIEAGYESPQSQGANATSKSAVVFIGSVVTVDLTSPPPNIGVRINCFTRQIDKTAHLTEAAPTGGTFLNLVKFAANQMGFGTNFECQTSHNDAPISNAFRTIYTQGGLLIGIQDLYRPYVAAFVDDDKLIVKDRDKVIDPSKITSVTEFIGVPSWNEWGVEWQTLMDPTINLAGAAKLTSLMNPGVNGTYVIYELQYQLTSREGPFYVRAMASQAA